MTEPVSPYELLEKRLDAFTRRLDDIDDGGVEALHQTRVASRRLRELLPLLSLKADTARELNRRLKKVTRQLGAVRELDVLIPLIKDLRRDARYSSAALRQVETAVDEARDAARKRVSVKLPPAKVRRLADRINRAVKDRNPKARHRKHRSVHRPNREWMWAAEARVVRRAARLADAMDAAGALYDPTRLHEVRIALKKLRYAIELGLEARKLQATADVVALKRAQDLLGHLHDVEILVTSTRTVQAEQASPHATASHDLESLLRSLEDDCRTLHARYMHDRRTLYGIANRLKDANSQRTLVRQRGALRRA